MFDLRVADFSLIHSEIQHRFKVIQRPFHLRIFTQLEPNAARFNTCLNVLQMFLIFIQPVLSGNGNGDLFAPTLFFRNGDKRLVLQKIEGRVNHARTGGVIPLCHALDLFDQLIAVAGVTRQDLQNHQS
ncbi:hypothetical protein D3C80_1584660 [compost metagenome]